MTKLIIIALLSLLIGFHLTDAGYGGDYGSNSDDSNDSNDSGSESDESGECGCDTIQGKSEYFEATSCEAGWYYYAGTQSCFIFGDKWLDWYSSEKFCQDTYSAHLASILDDDEYNWIQTKYLAVKGSPVKLWLGGTRNKDWKSSTDLYSWLFTNGDITDITDSGKGHWLPGEPSGKSSSKEYCLQMWNDSGAVKSKTFNDNDCQQAESYPVCKKAASPTVIPATCNWKKN